MKSNTATQEPGIEIGQWIFYPEFGRFIDHHGDEFFLDNRLTKLLQFLLERKNSIVKRNQIIEYVWDEVYATEESLTKGIFDLRKSLKEKEITEIEITTIRNKGYRLNLKEVTPGTKNRSMSKILMKSLLYLLLISSFLILFVRAIRYTN